MIMPGNVIHDTDAHKFYVSNDGREAYLRYRLFSSHGNNAVDFASTYVPDEDRGKGIAEKLVRAAIQWADAQGLELHASCWYAAKFIR